MKFNIGDLVKPNEKAYERNKIFTKDRRFVITAIDNKHLFNSLETWYNLAIKESKNATYILPEEEIELVRSFEWIF